jgi:hypothetical protein
MNSHALICIRRRHGDLLIDQNQFAFAIAASTVPKEV